MLTPAENHADAGSIGHVADAASVGVNECTAAEVLRLQLRRAGGSAKIVRLQSLT
jgi:hypothetical protein